METSLPEEGKQEARYEKAAWLLVGVAILLRTYHYLRNTPVWCDELWLLRNIVGKSFAELLGPLSDLQAAPPLFLWAERALWLLLGPSTYAMRLLPLLAGCGMMALLVPLGRRCLRGAALPAAVVLAGFSAKILNYTCDVKPYSIDSFLAVALPLLWCASERWQPGRRLGLFALLAPPVIFLSYPGCFIYGALLLALLPSVWRHRQQWQAWLGFAALLVSTGTAFLLLVKGPVRAQQTPELAALWTDYPDWHYPWTVPLWTGEAFLRFLEHLWRPTGAFWALPILVGVVSMWRRHKRCELVLLGVPGALALAAACAHAYPFESRVVLYWAAPLALIGGEGICVIMLWLKDRLIGGERANLPRFRFAMLASSVVLNVLLFGPLVKGLFDVVHPAPRLTEEHWPEATGASIHSVIRFNSFADVADNKDNPPPSGAVMIPSWGSGDGWQISEAAHGATRLPSYLSCRPRVQLIAVVERFESLSAGAQADGDREGNARCQPRNPGSPARARKACSPSVCRRAG